MNHPTTMGMLADAHRADIHEQARSARLAREARLHTSHHGETVLGAGRRRLVAAAVSLALALAMSAGVAFAQGAGGQASGGTGGGGCGSTGRTLIC